MTPPILGIFASAVTGGVSTTSFESIATTTLTTTTNSITFSSIPGTYAHLQLRISAQSSANDYYMRFQFNSSGTSGTYKHHELGGNGSGPFAGDGSGSDDSWAGPRVGYNLTSNLGAVIVDILDYTNTNKNKVCRALGGYDGNGSGIIEIHSGLWISTSAITSITIKPYIGGYISGSTFALYGIKAAA